MKTTIAIVLLHIVTACAHHKTAPEPVLTQPVTATTSDFADLDDQDMVHGRPPVYANASLDHLRVTIDGTMLTEPRLDRLRVATILEAIADAMASLPGHNPRSVSAIRADVATLRGGGLTAKRQAEIVRRALDEAIVDLRTNEPDSNYAAVERALTSVATVSPSRPIAKQTPAVRDALCAIGSAVETRGDMGDLRCLESRQASITPHRKRASVARTP